MFGHYFGECHGESCVEIFKLEKEQLFEDTRDKYPGNEFYTGVFVQKNNQQFDACKDLMDFFPSDLLSETATTIGMPDAGDWGGIYIEYNFKGTRKFWLLDHNKTNVPAKYHAFIDKVVEKIDLLQ